MLRIKIAKKPTGLATLPSEMIKPRTEPALVDDQLPAAVTDTPTLPIIKKINGSTIVSREELYKIVWSEPIIKSATRFGVSDVAVAKACRKHKIPLPGRGYWARIAAGQNVSRASLPPITNKALETIIFSSAPAGTISIKRSKIAEIQVERSIDKRIPVPEEPSELHPLVRRTLVVLSRVKPNDKGMLIPQDDALGLYVSPDQLSRAISIVDALIKALVSRGHAISVWHNPETPERYSYWERFARWKPFARIQVTIAGETIRFGLCESTNESHMYQHVKKSAKSNEVMPTEFPNSTRNPARVDLMDGPAPQRRRSGPVEGRNKAAPRKLSE